MLARRRIPDP